MNHLLLAVLTISLTSMLLAASTTHAEQDVPIIPRDVLFGNPERAQVRMSPDGKHLSWLAPLEGVLNVWVAPWDNPDDARPVTTDTNRGIRNHGWTYNNEQIIFIQDENGDEDWHVFAVDINTGTKIDLTPYENISARMAGASDRFPDHLLISINDRDPRFHDLYKVNTRTAERELLARNDRGFAGFSADHDFNVRLAVRTNQDGSIDWLVPSETEQGETSWTEYQHVPHEDARTTSIIGYTDDNQSVLIRESRDRNHTAIATLSLDTPKGEEEPERKLIAWSSTRDITGVLQHPKDHSVQGFFTYYKRQNRKIHKPEIEAHMQLLEGYAEGDLQLTARSLDDQRWVVAFIDDDNPVYYYTLDRETQTVRKLFSNNSRLEGLPLANTWPVQIRSRDGFILVGYLTLPEQHDPKGLAVPDRPLPMVLLVHGGPQARDRWGYNPQHQWLANRGYAVLSVNFRGSTGFGKGFLNAGNGEWAGKMHDDLIDAVDWAVGKRVADPDKVVIMGGSYGGYAALVGLTFTPDVFAAGISIVGPSNLETLLASIPPYWEAARSLMYKMIADPTTEEGREFLKERSPLTHVHRIQRPLLIGQGANDPRVKQAESDQIVDAMRAKNIPVTYVLYPDEGHGFARPENRMSFYAIAEAFLAETIGGRIQPVTKDDLQNSSITVPVGGEYIQGLEPVLSSHAAEEASADG